MAKRKQKSPTVREGINTTASALKLEVMELMETALKKLENGLAYLEKELHELRAAGTHNTSNANKGDKIVSKKQNIKLGRAKKNPKLTSKRKNSKK